MVFPIPSPLEQEELEEQPIQLQPQTDQILFYRLLHQRVVAQEEVAQRPVEETERTAVRVVVVAKAIHHSEQARQGKVATAAQQTLSAAVAAVAQVQRVETEQEAIPVRAAMVLHPQSAVHQLLMQVVVAAARMAFTTTTTTQAGRVAVEQVAMAACQPQEQLTQAAVAGEIQAFTVQIDPALMAVRVSS